MSSLLSSSGFVFATAMVASTAVFLAFFRHNKPHLSPSQISGHHKVQILRPCLSSGGNKERKKKKVQFAENVKKQTSDGREVPPEIQKNSEGKLKSRCGNEFPGIEGMPANRVALYHGILRDRSQRMGYSY